MKTLNLMPLMILLLIVLGCGESKIEETKSGRLNYIKTLKYGAVGTHGSQGWYVDDREFKVDGRRWKPDGTDVKNDLGNCEASPNAAVEALKCNSFKDAKELAFVLRMNASKPEWVMASDNLHISGKNLGEWVGDGRWLLFTNYYFNVETSERREIKGLPDHPEGHFCAASPDLKTIIYEETAFDTRFDLPPNESHEKEISEQYKLFYEHRDQGIIAFWLIDSESGKMKLLELKRGEYPIFALTDNHSQSGWLGDFQKMLVWEKDKNGKDQLVYPK